MAQTLNLQGFSSQNRLTPTSLTTDTATGVTSLPVGNSSGFTSGAYILIGGVGNQTSEMLTITAPSSGTAIPLSSATALPHSFDDAVTLLFGNQIKIYRANDVAGNGTQPPDANFSSIATVYITANNLLTSYTDASGSAGQWYKYTYYNSTTLAETQLSDSRAVQAGVVHYVSLDQVRRAAGFRTNSYVTDDIIAEKRDAAEKEVNGALTAVYSFPLPQPTNPIIVEIVKNIAAGELMHELYLETSPAMAAEGETKADLARHGGGAHTSLDELVMREVVLEDANFSDQSISDGNAVNGYPDATARGHATYQNGGGGQIFVPGMRY